MNNPSTGVLWVNGRFRSAEEPALSALDRGFTLGDGLFETMQARRGRVFRLPQHLARLRRGGGVLGLPIPPDGEIMAVLQEVLARAGEGPAVVRLTISRGIDQGRGISLPSHGHPSLVVRTTPLARPTPEAYGRGYTAIVASLRRNETSPLSRIKSCNYLDSILARKEASEQGCDEAIMLNTRGEVACASVANVFAIQGGAVWTPPEESGALAGVTRGCLLELAATLGIEAHARPFGADFLLGAEEAFLSNTVVGVMPLTQVAGRKIGSGIPGPVTTRLAEAYEQAAETAQEG